VYLLALLSLLFAREPDYLIVAGVRVGPVTRTSTEASLLKAFGKQAFRASINIGEGMTEPGLILYAEDPARRLAILWNDDKPVGHPATIFICYEAPDPPCRWRTSTGITLGTTLKDLERLNGKPFEMVVWGSDVGGNVTDYHGGTLNRRLGLTLVPRIDKEGNYSPHLTDEEFASVQGEKFVPSNDPVLQKLNPYVAAMHLTLPGSK
jgi:hypothetical protein